MAHGARMFIRRLSPVIALALGGALLSAIPAAAQEGAPGLEVKENHARVTVTGPGIRAHLNKHRLDVRIDEDAFGDPSGGFPVERVTQEFTGPDLRPFECQNGTYAIESATFDQTLRVSSTEPRPLPYTEEFNDALPGILTFVGELRGTATDAEGDTVRLVVSDIVEEVAAEDGFASTVAIHGYFVDEDKRVRDRISLIGLINVGPDGEDASYLIEDRGTCRQVDDLDFGPGSADAVVTGPLFVLPFSAPVKEIG
jgi:hypothetical protein